jgi:hypothetical protein
MKDLESKLAERDAMIRVLQKPPPILAYISPVNIGSSYSPDGAS